MSARFLSAVFTVIAVVSAAPLAAFDQAAANDWTPPRTPDGMPDIQGLFTFRTITPLQRPKESMRSASVGPSTSSRMSTFCSVL